MPHESGKLQRSVNKFYFMKTRVNYKGFLLFTLLLLTKSICSQTINLYSVADDRQVGGDDNGYTLNGKQMTECTRPKLLNPASFGPNGVYPKTINIIDDFATSGSLANISRVPKGSLFFMGCFNQLDQTMEQFTKEELDSLYNWSLRGGKMIITSGVVYNQIGYNSDYLNDKWGYVVATQHCSLLATPEGLVTDLFNGPFGSYNKILQGAMAQGFFHKMPPNSKVLARNENGKPTMFMDCKTLDLFVPDVDVYTFLSNTPYYNENMIMIIEGVTNGPNLSTANDRFIANSIVFMDKLQDQPLLVTNGDELSVSDGYVNYQWYKNGEPIQNSNKAKFNMDSKDASYYVEVEVNGGCIVKSNEYDPECLAFVPTAFSPDNNNMNDKACVYGSCLNDAEFKIFDRWGELIFKSSPAEKCWDGMYKGKKASEGTYAWTFEGTRASGKKAVQKGNITLIR